MTTTRNFVLAPWIKLGLRNCIDKWSEQRKYLCTSFKFMDLKIQQYPWVWLSLKWADHYSYCALKSQSTKILLSKKQHLFVFIKCYLVILLSDNHSEKLISYLITTCLWTGFMSKKTLCLIREFSIREFSILVSLIRLTCELWLL